MPRKLNNWSYESVTNFLEEHSFSFYEDLDGRHVWIKLQGDGAPDRIVELRFGTGQYAERTMKSIIRQSGIVESEWLDWSPS